MKRSRNNEKKQKKNHEKNNILRNMRYHRYNLLLYHVRAMELHEK